MFSAHLQHSLLILNKYLSEYQGKKTGELYFVRRLLLSPLILWKLFLRNRLYDFRTKLA